MSDLLVRTALAVLGIAVPAFLAGFLFSPAWGWALFSVGRAGLSQPLPSLRLEAAVLSSKEQTQSKP